MKLVQTLTAFAAAIGVAAAFAVGAQAHSTHSLTVKITTRVETPAQQVQTGRAQVKHAADVLRFLQNHPTAGRTYRVHQRVRKNHLWLLHVGRVNMAVAHARLDAIRRAALARAEAARVRALVSNHLSMWLCIHRGEGAWNDEGAPYYGGLQMTYGWEGLVGDAAALAPAQQIAAAEEGWRRNGYSVAWLYGQWPQTAPPCV